MNILIENAATPGIPDQRWSLDKTIEPRRQLCQHRAALAAAKSEPIEKFNIVGQFGGADRVL